MKKHGSVQIEGMGECISLVFKFAQILSKNGFAVIEKIREDNMEERNPKAIKPKIAITLKKSADFDKLTEGITLKN